MAVEEVAQIATPEGAETQQGVYIGLALLLGSFLSTFFVIPLFRDEFKEPSTWKEIYAELTEEMGGVKSIKAEEAASKAANGAILMDVRMPSKFEGGAMQHSQNYYLYQPITGWGLAANLRRAGFAFFGVYGSELNKTFVQDVEASVPKDAQIIVACEQGGTLTPKNGAETGFQSQSLKAAYFLKKAGFSNVLHLEGGASEYSRTVAELVPGSEVVPKGKAPVAVK